MRIITLLAISCAISLHSAQDDIQETVRVSGQPRVMTMTVESRYPDAPRPGVDQGMWSISMDWAGIQQSFSCMVVVQIASPEQFREVFANPGLIERFGRTQVDEDTVTQIRDESKAIWKRVDRFSDMLGYRSACAEIFYRGIVDENLPEEFSGDEERGILEIIGSLDGWTLTGIREVPLVQDELTINRKTIYYFTRNPEQAGEAEQ